MNYQIQNLRCVLLQIGNLPIWFFIIICLSTARDGVSQISATLLVGQPVSPRLEYWDNNPNSLQIFLLCDRPRSVRFHATLEQTSGGHFHAESNDNYAFPRRDLPAGSTNLNFRDLRFTDPNAVHVSGANTTNIARGGSLPEGEYLLCIQVLDYISHAPLSSNSCSAPFEIRYADAPTLIAPRYGEVVSAETPQRIFFNWLPPPGAFPLLQYEFSLTALASGQNADGAFSSGVVLFTRTFAGTTSLNYGAAEPPLQTGRNYAWRVRAIDPANTINFRNNGYSAASQFTYSESNSSICNTPTIQIVYPPVGSRIPYRSFPVYIKFDPYCDSYRHFHSTFQFDGSPPRILDLNWRIGPCVDEGTSTRSLSNEQAQYVAVSDPGLYTPGHDLLWNANITLQNSGLDILREVHGNFSVGMNAPVPQLPPNDTIVIPGEVTLQWQTEAQPSDSVVITTNEIRQSPRPGHGAAFTPRVSERWMLEVSRHANFSELIHFRFGMFGEGIEPSSQSASQISALLSTTIQDRYRYVDSGDYYWRVKWLNRIDPAANDTSAYSWSPVFHFVMNIESHALPDCIEISAIAPSDGGAIHSDQPFFAVRVYPDIDTTAISGGRLQIWRMESDGEDHVRVTERAAIYDERFAGADASAFLSRDREQGIFDLAFASGSHPTHPFHPVLGTSYLWRFTLQFEGNRIRLDSHNCRVSSITSSGSVFTYNAETPAERSTSCADECSAVLPVDMQGSPMEFHPNDILHLGKFILHLTEAHGSGLSLSGRGWIPVGFMHNFHIAVSFTDLTVNRMSEVIGGTAHAVWGGDSPLPDLSSHASSLGLTQDQMADLQRVIGQPARLISQIVQGSPLTLPIGIDTLVGGERLTIGILSMDFTSQNGQLSAAISIPMPMLGPGIGIGLGARNICFSPQGLGGDGRATLYLPADFGYRDNVENNWGFVFKGPTMDGGSMSDSGTYVTWDCHGFQKFRLASEVVFPRSWLVPIDSSGQVVPAEKVRAGFTTMIERNYLSAHHSNWGWMATGTINGRFAVPDAPDFVFDVHTIAIDQSDNENAPGMTFPPGYAGETGTSWRGFYINTLMMSLPNQFRTLDAGRPVQFAINNLMIDHSGVSASVRVNNVVAVNYGGWRGEIDTIGLDFVSSSLAGGFLSGRILTPLSSTNWLQYRAALNHPSTGGVQFVFNVHLTESIQSDLWAARLTLDPTTRIELRAGGGEGFVALLLMSGSISIAGDLHAPSGASAGSMPGVNFNNIRFQNIALSTQRPYLGCADANGVIQESRSGCIEAPVFGMAGSGGSGSSSSGESSASGFALSISEISIHADLSDMNHLKFGLGLNVTIHFQSGANGVGGGTTMTVWTRLDHAQTQPTLSFDGISLNAINLDVEVGSTVRIAGRVDFYGDNDPIYGNGFRGHVRASFLGKVTAEATVQFGSKMRSAGDLDPFRYWYVDAMVYLPTGIPFMTGLAFYGFGGGAWYNMDFDRTVREPPAPTTPAASSTTAEVPPGYTASGYRFIPSAPSGTDNAFGFRAKVAIGTYGSDQVFNADITLSVQFIRGGIESILLEGDGFLLAGIHSRGDAIATCHVMTEYRFVEQTLDMNLSVALRSPYSNFVQLLSADHAITFHADPHRWFFRAGTPVDPTGLRVAGFLNVQTYLMAGTDILPPAPLPTEIRSRLGDPPVVRTAEMRTGDGFALGGLINLQTPRIEVFPVWGQFQVLVGFDFGLIHYQPPTTCIGSLTPVGSNGWYGSGRLFAYFSGSVGFFNPFRDTSDPLRYWVLAEISIPGVIAGGTPNPTWASGALSGAFSYRDLVGHLQHTEFHTQFRVGDECHPTPRPRENPMAGLELISELYPSDGSHDIVSSVLPRASLDYHLDERFAVNETSDDGSTRLRTFRVKIRNFTIARHEGTREQLLQGRFVVSDDHTHVVLTPEQPLEGAITYTLKVSAYAEELSGGVWTIARTRNGRSIDDTVASVFVTSTPLDTITAIDVSYSYPLDRQRYFLQSECRTGIIQLVAPNPQLFNSTMHRAGNQVSYVARFMHSLGGGVIESPAIYNPRQTRIEFQIPPLDHRTVYSLQIIRHEIFPPGTSDPNPPQRTNEPVASGNSGSATKSGSIGKSGTTGGARLSSGDSLGRGEKLLYRYYFRTSQFDRLQQKVEALTPLPTEHPNPFGHWEILRARYSTAEPFDTYDMNGYYTPSGTAEVPPLIRLNANSRTAPWHTSYTNPWIYTPIDRLRSMHLWSTQTDFERYTDNYSHFPIVHPSELLAVYDSPPDQPVSDQDLRRSSQGSAGQVLRISYAHGVVIPNDQNRLRNNVASIISAYGSDSFTDDENRFLRSILSKPYELFYHGEYPLSFIYGYTGCNGKSNGADGPTSTMKGIRY